MYMGKLRQRLEVSEINQKLPILIIDKKGSLGSSLAEMLREQFLIVLVSGKELIIHENIIHIPYRKRIPLIPDNSYSHIFIFYNGESEMIEMLPSFVKKANETNGKLFFILPILHSTRNLLEKLSPHIYHAMQIIIYGEIFDNQLSEVNELTYFIHQTRTTGRIEVPNDGLKKLYPVFLGDVLGAIIAIGFAFERKKRILFAFPKAGITELSTIRILQKINPLLKIDFREHRDTNPQYYIPPEGTEIFSDYDLEKKLRQIDTDKKNRFVPSRKQKIAIARAKKSRKPLRLFLALLVILLFLPIIAVSLCSAGGAWAIQSSLKDIEQGKFESAKNNAAFAANAFSSAEVITNYFFITDTFVYDLKQQFLRKIQTGQDAANEEIDILNAALVLQNIYNGNSSDPKNDFLHALATIKNSLLVLQQMKAEGQLPSEISGKLVQVNDLLNYFENTIDAYPNLLGFEGKRRYLVLFQNNMELRPGGGFIGSYGILELENGKIGDFKVSDVYDADGKLTVHVEPPFSIRRYLGVNHWFLRDSNMDIDFTKDADEAMRFLELEAGQKVDGVIAIDTEFLKKMLSVFGKVTVPGFNETVNPDNFYLLTQTAAEKDFHPGSTQKKGFLQALESAMFLELSVKNSIPWSSFAKQTADAIKEKHVLFAFSDPAIQKLFTVNNLSGSLWDGRKADDNMYLDFFGVSDANIGVNKANYYLKRSLQQDVTFDINGNFRSTATVIYDNTSSKTSPFGGDYKNYVRFLLPEHASLQSISIDNQAVSTTPAVTDPAVYTKPDFIPPPQMEVEETVENGKTLIGFLVLVPTGTTRKVSITYTVDNAVNPNVPAFSYSLRLFKQPGTGDDPYTFFLTYPQEYTFVKGDGVSDVGGKITYADNLSEDKIIEAEFSKK